MTFSAGSALARILLAASSIPLAFTAVHAEGEVPTAGRCAATIAKVIADISTRDLDTSRGPPLNAFITINPNALAQAEALDHKSAGEPPGPLFCMPVAVKDNFDTYDMPVTVGSLALVGSQPPRDAPFVERLRSAGAVLVGKTNMDEFAMGIRGLSGTGGRVGNAYDTAQSAGGSSSGSGAAVGAGLVPLAVGSDNCGSLRLPAVYNGAVSLRATYERFDTAGIFPIGFVNGVPGLIARDTATLRKGLAVAGDGWRSGAGSGLRGMRIGVLRRFDRKDPWSPADADSRRMFGQAITVIRQAGAEIVEGVELNDFNARLGPEFLKGFARRVDAALGSYPVVRRNWADVCGSRLIRPEWTARECIAAGASSARLEQQAENRIADNRRKTLAVLDRLALDALLYPVDGRGGARSDTSTSITCFIASSTGMPAVAFPVGLDWRGMPMGVELMGRPFDDEALVAMMAAYEAARGPLPEPPRLSARADLATLEISRQNELRVQLGRTAFRSRRGRDLGALVPEKFRALTDEVVNAAVAGR